MTASAYTKIQLNHKEAMDINLENPVLTTGKP